MPSVPGILYPGKPVGNPRFAAGLFPPESEADREDRLARDFQAAWNAAHPDMPINLDEARTRLVRIGQTGRNHGPKPVRPPSIYDVLAGRIGIEAYRAARGLAAPAAAVPVPVPVPAATVEALTWSYAVAGRLASVATAEQLAVALGLLNSDAPLSGVMIRPIGPSLAVLEARHATEIGGGS